MVQRELKHSTNAVQDFPKAKKSSQSVPGSENLRQQETSRAVNTTARGFSAQYEKNSVSSEITFLWSKA